MKITSFETTKKISNFTKRCLLNDNQDKTLENWKKANNIDEFKELMLNYDNSRDKQSYWQLAREYKGFRILIHEYLEKIAKYKYFSMSEVGSLKIGNDDFSYNVSNKYGDTISNTIYIIENDIKLEFNFITTINGNNINIYDYDCGNDVLHTLKGEYALYVEEKIFIFVKRK